jgi:sugar diacid utilization regulator
MKKVIDEMMKMIVENIQLMTHPPIIMNGPDIKASESKPGVIFKRKNIIIRIINKIKHALSL